MTSAALRDVASGQRVSSQSLRDEAARTASPVNAASALSETVPVAAKARRWEESPAHNASTATSRKTPSEPPTASCVVASQAADGFASVEASLNSAI